MTDKTLPMDDPSKALFTAMTFIRDPILWAAGAAGTILGVTVPAELLTSSHGVWIGLLALLGGFFGKLLQVWLQFRQQRATEHESQAARFERMLNEQREDHHKEVERLIKRIEKLEGERDRPSS